MLLPGGTKVEEKENRCLVEESGSMIKVRPSQITHHTLDKSDWA